MLLSQDDILAFQDQLLSWFNRRGRDFSWRLTGDAYAVLVAEKLLQQTAARNVVVRAYEQFLRLYPTPKRLAQACVQEIEDIVRPLGFTYRAKDLHDTAQALVTRHNGEVLRDLNALLALPGVGDYAARAVLSFVIGKDVPVVDTNWSIRQITATFRIALFAAIRWFSRVSCGDSAQPRGEMARQELAGWTTNVARFLYRLYGIPGSQPANPARNKSLIKRATMLVPPGHSREYNLAVLDLCALVCKVANPDCPVCPVQPYCTYGIKRVG